ncbi:hypothetical protein BGZ79_000282 [Entomortierella chlamydospora]|nr:hypothetical protein BGZ79_000282 [Entomortierella chlamydospora]
MTNDIQLRGRTRPHTSRSGIQKAGIRAAEAPPEAPTASYWNQLKPDARVCLILNRFTRNRVVMYASSACEKAFHVDPEDITGKPFLLYICADDLAPFVEQMTLVRGTAAALVPIVKLPARDSLRGVLHWRKECSSISSRSTPPRYDEYGFTVWSQSRNAPRAALNRIRIFELESDERARPADLPTNDSNLVLDSDVISMVPASKELIIQDYVDNDGSDDSDDRTGSNINLSLGQIEHEE